MKSTKIRAENIPSTALIRKTIHVKPTAFLAVILILGIVLVLFPRPYIVFGVWMILLSLFGLTAMPDRKLCSFSDEFLVLYNQNDADMCTLIRYRDISGWKYERHRYQDQLVFTLDDGSSEVQEMYSRHAAARYLKRYLPEKEIRKSSRGGNRT